MFAHLPTSTQAPWIIVEFGSSHMFVGEDAVKIGSKQFFSLKYSILTALQDAL